MPRPSGGAGQVLFCCPLVGVWEQAWFSVLFYALSRGFFKTKGLAMMSNNPFYQPISRCWEILRSVRWEFPFFPAFITSLITAFILGLLAILFMTVGVASMTRASFWAMMEEARGHLRKATSMEEKSGHAIAIGIYSLIYLPLWLIHLPFLLLGMLWDRIGIYTLAPIALLVGLFFVDWNWVAEKVRENSDQPSRPSTTEKKRPTTAKSKSKAPGVKSKDNQLGRKWTSDDGTHVAEAEYVSSPENGVITLRKADGSTVNVPLSRLSAADQAWVRQQTGE